MGSNAHPLERKTDTEMDSAAINTIYHINIYKHHSTSCFIVHTSFVEVLNDFVHGCIAFDIEGVAFSHQHIQDLTHLRGSQAQNVTGTSNYNQNESNTFHLGCIIQYLEECSQMAESPCDFKQSGIFQRKPAPPLCMKSIKQLPGFAAGHGSIMVNLSCFDRSTEISEMAPVYEVC